MLASSEHIMSSKSSCTQDCLETMYGYTRLPVEARRVFVSGVSERDVGEESYKRFCCCVEKGMPDLSHLEVWCVLKSLSGNELDNFGCENVQQKRMHCRRSPSCLRVGRSDTFQPVKIIMDCTSLVASRRQCHTGHCGASPLLFLKNCM